MSSLKITRSVGQEDRIALGSLALIADANITQWRVALHPDDLPLAHWRPVTERVMSIPWLSTGTQQVWAARAYAEVDNGTSTEVLGAVETQRTVGAPRLVAPNGLNSPSGYIMRISSDGEPAWPAHHYNDGGRYPQGNNFIPLMWHSDGYLWITHRTWDRDIGETIPGGAHDVILARFTPKDFNASVDRIDLSASGVSIRAKVGTDGSLNLNGGYICFAVVCSFTDGKRGRYHLRRAFTIGSGLTFPESYWGLPSGSNTDWQCTFAADNVGISNMPSGPEISRVEEIDIIARDYTALPTGQLRIKEIAVKS